MNSVNINHVGERVEDGFFGRCVDEVAAELVGCYLFADSQEGLVGGQIIEVEAYCENDPAAHCHPEAHATRIAESKAMSSVGACVYLYPARLHYYDGAWCLNFTCGRAGLGSAVLIRALRPLVGCELMRDRRRRYSDSVELKDDAKYMFALCNGPANLWEALGWLDDRKWNGMPISEAGLRILRPPNQERSLVFCGERVGIPAGNAAKAWPRSYVLDDPAVRNYLSPDARTKQRYAYPPPQAPMRELKTCGMLRCCKCV